MKLQKLSNFSKNLTSEYTISHSNELSRPEFLGKEGNLGNYFENNYHHESSKTFLKTS